MKAFVLDASLAMEWFSDSASSEVLAKRSLLDERVAVVPHLWRYEVMNVVASWHRRKEVSRAKAARVLRDALQLPFGVVDDGDPEAVLEIAARHRLSAYDATYVRAAMLTGEPLASLDRALVKAATAEGVVCV